MCVRGSPDQMQACQFSIRSVERHKLQYLGVLSSAAGHLDPIAGGSSRKRGMREKDCNEETGAPWSSLLATSDSRRIQVSTSYSIYFPTPEIPYTSNRLPFRNPESPADATSNFDFPSLRMTRLAGRVDTIACRQATL